VAASSDSYGFAGALVVEHPFFGPVTFVFDSDDAASGYAVTDGFVFFGREYPKFDFVFERKGNKYVPSEMNSATKQPIGGRLQSVSEIAPPAFRSFVLSKAKELAQQLQ
jgi:hypothetical protein